MDKEQKVFVSYIDDNNRPRSGYFNKVVTEGNFVKISSDKNEITIPASRIKKIKRGLQ